MARVSDKGERKRPFSFSPLRRIRVDGGRYSPTKYDARFRIIAARRRHSAPLIMRPGVSDDGDGSSPFIALAAVAVSPSATVSTRLATPGTP